MVFLQIFIAIPVVVLVTQLYLFAMSREGELRQVASRGLGITFSTCGVVSLVFHRPFFVLLGFFLIMVGLLLMAKGLDRLDKKIYIDRYVNEPGQE